MPPFYTDNNNLGMENYLTSQFNHFLKNSLIILFFDFKLENNFILLSFFF